MITRKDDKTKKVLEEPFYRVTINIVEVTSTNVDGSPTNQNQIKTTTSDHSLEVANNILVAAGQEAIAVKE